MFECQPLVVEKKILTVSRNLAKILKVITPLRHLVDRADDLWKAWVTEEITCRAQFRI